MSFRLRTTILVVAIFSTVFGWVSWQLKESREQPTAISKIKEVGGTIYYDYQQLPGTGEGRSAPVFSDERRRPPRSLIRKLLGKLWPDVVVAVDLVGDHITDDHVALVQDLPHLAYVIIKSRNVTDKSIHDIGALTKLKILGINDAPITDNGINQLRSSTALIGLGLINSEVTDEGVRQLQRALPQCYIARKKGEQ
jgi:hypothetical protein